MFKQPAAILLFCCLCSMIIPSCNIVTDISDDSVQNSPSNKTASNKAEFQLTGLQQPQGWLESEDIERYGNYLEEKYSGKIKVYSNGSNGHGLGDDWITSEQIAEIRRQWTDGTDGFGYRIEKGLENIPIHYFPTNLGNVQSNDGGAHWTGIIVDTNSNTIEYYDSSGGRPPPEHIVSRMEVIEAEFSHLTDRSFTRHIVPVRHQMDGFNCGVFSLHYAELKAQGLSSEDILKRDLGSKITKIREAQRINLYGMDNRSGYFEVYKARRPEPRLTSPDKREWELAIKNSLLFEDHDIARRIWAMDPDQFIAAATTDEKFLKKIGDINNAAHYAQTAIDPEYKGETRLTQGEYEKIIKQYNLLDYLNVQRDFLARVQPSPPNAVNPKAAPSFNSSNKWLNAGLDERTPLINHKGSRSRGIGKKIFFAAGVTSIAAAIAAGIIVPFVLDKGQQKTN